jgi:CTP synthase
MVGSQFHPEFRSRLDRPHPLFQAFIHAALTTVREGDQVRLPLDSALPLPEPVYVPRG